MSVFTFLPDYGLNRSVKPTVKAIKFGDGYEQRIASGLNTMPKVWNLKFSARSNSEINDIENFLIAAGGVNSFEWTPPDDSGVGRYVCREWNKSMDHYNINTITAKFEQVFEP